MHQPVPALPAPRRHPAELVADCEKLPPPRQGPVHAPLQLPLRCLQPCPRRMAERSRAALANRLQRCSHSLSKHQSGKAHEPTGLHPQRQNSRRPRSAAAERFVEGAPIGCPARGGNGTLFSSSEVVSPINVEAVISEARAAGGPARCTPAQQRDNCFAL